MRSSANTVRLSAPLRRVSLEPLELPVKTVRADEAEAAREAAYRQGYEDATNFLNQQVAEQRAEVIQLVEQTFAGVEAQHSELVRQFGAALPAIAMEIARRVLCGLEPDRRRVELAINEVLQELAPGTRDIRVFLNASDLSLIGSYDEKFRERFPGLRFEADPALNVGDCRLSSSFGLVDATLATKLQNVARSLQ